MAFDEAKFKNSGANAKLEKPFEANALRALVSKLAPGATPRSLPGAPINPISEHIELPSIAFEAPIGTVPPAKDKEESSKEAKTEKIEMKNDWSTSDFQDLNSFSASLIESNTQVTKTRSPPLPNFGTPQNTPNSTTPNPSSWNNDNEWVKKDLGKFSVPLPEEENQDAVPFEYTENKIVDTSFLFRPGEAGMTSVFHQQTNIQEPPLESAPAPSALSATSLSIEELANIKLEAREIIEKIAWKLVPELANQIIKEELERLLSTEK